MTSATHSEGFHVIMHEGAYKVMFSDGERLRDPFEDLSVENEFNDNQEACKACNYMKYGMMMTIKMTRELIGV